LVIQVKASPLSTVRLKPSQINQALHQAKLDQPSTLNQASHQAKPDRPSSLNHAKPSQINQDKSYQAKPNEPRQVIPSQAMSHSTFLVSVMVK
jgi:hypothetical protein